MPLQYSSIVDEHRAVRTHAGLFDISHMGELKVAGPDALAFLQHLVPNDVSHLAIHQALYTTLCLPNGNVIDDLLIYRLADIHYMLVVNAANIDKDFAWIEEQAKPFKDIHISNQSDTTALLSLQGPAAQAVLQPLTDSQLSSIPYYHSTPGIVANINCLISRTGYTGEDGFELYCLPVDVTKLWKDLLNAGKSRGLLPAGLGARDTLRLEAAYCLYGHELDEHTNPLEANLAWTVKLPKGPFIGRDALLQVKEHGPKRKLIGIEMLERGIPRSGYRIYQNDQPIGVLTSGGPGLTVNKNIGLGYVDTAHALVGNTLHIDIRGQRTAAQIVALPFYKRQKP